MKIHMFLLVTWFTYIWRLILQSVLVHVSIGARRQLTKNPVCSTAKSAAILANVFLQGPMQTRKNAHATIIGRQREGGQNALRTSLWFPFRITSHFLHVWTWRLITSCTFFCHLSTWYRWIRRLFFRFALLLRSNVISAQVCEQLQAQMDTAMILRQFW